MVGPRIFQTGNPIYGFSGGGGAIHQGIVDDAEARSALIRIKVEGGPASFSYKNYMLPSRYVVTALSRCPSLTFGNSFASEASTCCS